MRGFTIRGEMRGLNSKKEGECDMTRYILKHRNRDVALLYPWTKMGTYIPEIASPEYMPILGNGTKNLAEWIQNRAIPEGRPDLSKILRETGCKTALGICCRIWHSVRQTPYWICPENLKE